MLIFIVLLHNLAEHVCELCEIITKIQSNRIIINIIMLGIRLQTILFSFARSFAPVGKVKKQIEVTVPTDNNKDT